MKYRATSLWQLSFLCYHNMTCLHLHVSFCGQNKSASIWQCDQKLRIRPVLKLVFYGLILCHFEQLTLLNFSLFIVFLYLCEQDCSGISGWFFFLGGGNTGAKEQLSDFRGHLELWFCVVYFCVCHFGALLSWLMPSELDLHLHALP